jgi:hypothetical protein
MTTNKERQDLPDLGTFAGTPEEVARHMEDLALATGEYMSGLEAEIAEDSKKVSEAEANAEALDAQAQEYKRQAVQYNRELNRKLGLPEDTP